MMKVNYETLRELLFDSDKSFSKSDILKKGKSFFFPFFKKKYFNCISNSHSQ